MRDLFLKTREFYQKNERAIIAIALFGGFLVDNFTLQRIDLPFENFILFSYLVIAGISILIINAFEQDEGRRFFRWLRLISPVSLQFAFGGLFSGFVIFYFRSATFGVSWPFLLFLLLIMIGNEVFSKKLTRMTFQIGVFFTALFSFAIFYIPILVKDLGTPIFIFSGIVSLILIQLFMALVGLVNKERFEKTKRQSLLVVLVIFVLVNVAYFSNIIPPIPLSLKDSQLAYFVSRGEGGQYLVTKKADKLFSDLFFSKEFELSPSDPVYLYTSVFSPTDLDTTIVHEWQYKQNERWITASSVSFSISGGRDGGFRGFSVKRTHFEGDWRVNIKTPQGQVIGRVPFELIYTFEPLSKETVIY